MAKIELDFTGKFKALDGENMFYYDESGVKKDLENINIYFSNLLVNLKTDQPMQNILLAQRIYTEGKIEVTAEESIFIKKRAEELEVSDILKGQILKAFK